MNTEENSTSALCDWIKLSKDEDYRVRRAVARNPNTPVDTLVELSKDEDENVRRCVAYNPNTPRETLIKLSNDEDENVRYFVVKNPNTIKEFQLYIKAYGQEVSILQDLEEEWEIFRLSQIEENFNLPVFCPFRHSELFALSKH